MTKNLENSESFVIMPQTIKLKGVQMKPENIIGIVAGIIGGGALIYLRRVVKQFNQKNAATNARIDKLEKQGVATVALTNKLDNRVNNAESETRSIAKYKRPLAINFNFKFPLSFIKISNGGE